MPPAEAGHETLRWQNVVISLQTLLGCRSRSAAGQLSNCRDSALSVFRARREVDLYGNRKTAGWVFKLKLENRFVFIMRRSFSK